MEPGHFLAASLLPLLCLSSCGREAKEAARPATGRSGHRLSPLHDPREVHLRNVRQLTFGGENAEGYFSSDGRKIIFQARSGGTGFDCDQIFEMDLATLKTRLLSTGKGRTTCAHYLEGDRSFLYASTHLGGERCPANPDRSRGYVWPLYQAYDIFVAPLSDPSNLLRLTKDPGYDAEATVCYATNLIIFTSMRDGDLELYSMRTDGSGLRRLTHRVGYDGGAFFSQDGRKIVWRAGYPRTEAEEIDYRSLLAEGLVRPSHMEIWVANADGSGARQITDNGKANFAPYFFPDGQRIIFASNLEGRRLFHLFAADTDGKNLERITYSSVFNSFPMFSPDGKHLVFASNRNNKKKGETNLFLAEWVD